MAEDKPIKLRFADDFKSPTLEIGHGSEYVRKFDAKDQPFEMTGLTHTEPGSDGTDRVVIDMAPEEEARILLSTGHFVEDGKEQRAAVASERKSKAKIVVDSPTPS